jgi:hypothetical protein
MQRQNEIAEFFHDLSITVSLSCCSGHCCQSSDGAASLYHSIDNGKTISTHGYTLQYGRKCRSPTDSGL